MVSESSLEADISDKSRNLNEVREWEDPFKDLKKSIQRSSDK